MNVFVSPTHVQQLHNSKYLNNLAEDASIQNHTNEQREREKKKLLTTLQMAIKITIARVVMVNCEPKRREYFTSDRDLGRCVCEWCNWTA